MEGRRILGVSGGVAKDTPPVRTSFDHFVDNVGYCQISNTAAREAAAVANQEAMDRIRAKNQREEGVIRLTQNVSRVMREARESNGCKRS